MTRLLEHTVPIVFHPIIPYNRDIFTLNEFRGTGKGVPFCHGYGNSRFKVLVTFDMLNELSNDIFIFSVRLLLDLENRLSNLLVKYDEVKN